MCQDISRPLLQEACFSRPLQEVCLSRPQRTGISRLPWLCNAAQMVVEWKLVGSRPCVGPSRSHDYLGCATGFIVGLGDRVLQRDVEAEMLTASLRDIRTGLIPGTRLKLCHGRKQALAPPPPPPWC